MKCWWCEHAVLTIHTLILMSVRIHHQLPPVHAVRKPHPAFGLKLLWCAVELLEAVDDAAVAICGRSVSSSSMYSCTEYASTYGANSSSTTGGIWVTCSMLLTESIAVNAGVCWRNNVGAPTKVTKALKTSANSGESCRCQTSCSAGGKLVVYRPRREGA